MKEILKRKGVGTLLLLALLTFLLPQAHAVVRAEDSDYTYTVLSDGTAEVTGYTGGYSGITIPKTLDGYMVTSVGKRAFAGNTRLTSVILPDGLLTIGYGAFDGCTALTTVAIPESVTKIDSYAFDECTSLTDIQIPGGLTELGIYTFYNCKSVESFVIPEGVDKIGNYTFYGCSKLKEITLPDEMTALGNYVFYGCSSLTSITIPEGVTSIGDYAFDSCSSLTSITIPEGVTSIGDYAFDSCSSLTSITIPEGVTSIGDYAFFNCKSLTTVTIPEGVTSIGSGVFYYCGSLTTVTIPEGVTSIRYATFRECYSLISVIIPKGVTSIGESAFNKCESLVSVTIPEGVTSIGNYAFEYCSSLTEVTIPKGASLSYNSFTNCSKLGDVYYGGNRQSWKYSSYVNGAEVHYSIADCEISLEYRSHAYTGEACRPTVTVEDGSVLTEGTDYKVSYSDNVEIGTARVTIEGSGSYWGSTQQEFIIRKGNVTVKYVNEEDTELTSSDIVEVMPGETYETKGKEIAGYRLKTTPENAVGVFASDITVTYIYEQEEDELSYEVLGNGMVSITGYTGTQLELILPSILDGRTVTTIGNNAFSSCTQLTGIQLPNKVSSISTSAFFGCSKLECINIIESNENYTSVDGVLFNKNMTTLLCFPAGKTVERYVVPEGVTKIGSCAFGSCTGVSEIELPEGITGIESYAFQMCSGLLKLWLPSSVQLIYSDSFSDCENLKDVYYGGSTQSWRYSSYFRYVTVHYNIADCDIIPEYTSILYTGDACEPTVIVQDGNMVLIAGVGYTVSYEDNIQVGTAKITIAGEGDYWGSVELEFEITGTITVEYVDEDGAELADTVSIGASKGETYKIKAKKIEGYRLKTTPENASGEFTGNTTVTFVYEDLRNIEDCGIELEYSEIEYIAGSCMPVVTVTDQQTTLLEDSDYEVSYADNENIGTATVTISGKGRYIGSVSKEFTIIQRTMENCTFELEYESTEYTGSTQIPSITIKNGGTVLSKGVDYSTVRDVSNDYTYKYAGGYKILIKGRGNYTGKVEVEYTITPKNLSDCTVELEYTNTDYTGAARKPAVTVQHFDTVLTLGTDYEVSYSNNTEIGAATATVSGIGNYTGSVEKTFTITDSSVEKGTVVVKYVDEDGNVLATSDTKRDAVGNPYTTSPKTISGYTLISTPDNASGTHTAEDITVTYVYAVTVMVKDLEDCSVELEYTNTDYTGNACRPEVTVKDQDTVLTEETDYEVNYYNNIGIGTATVKVSGIGNYTGSVEKTFTITDSGVEKGTVVVKYVDEDGNVLATSDTKRDAVGNPYTTSPKTISGYTLISTPDNASGTYTAEDITVTYVYAVTVTVKDLEDCIVELEYTNTDYMGDACEPKVTVKDQDTVLIEGADYEVSYYNNIEIGTATVTVSGIGNYIGSIEKTFTITDSSVEKGTVVVKYVDEDGNVLATSDTKRDAVGNPYTTSPKTVSGYTLISMPDNASGTYTAEDITVTYVYAVAFTIKDLEDCTIELEYINTEYTGDACEPEVTVKDQDTVLTKGADYEVSYYNNIEIGTATVTVSGIGNYTGLVEKEFTITAAGVEKGTVVVKYVDENGTELAASDTKIDAIGNSYTTSPKMISGYSLKSTPDNASGTYMAEDITVTYVYAVTITIKNLEDCTLELEYKNTSYTGKACEPKVTVKDQDTVLTKGTDYEVSYRNNKEIGTATVTVSGIGNYKGSIEQEFTITASEAEKGTVVVKYVDENGTEIAASDTKKDEVGKPYTTSPKTINGYTLKSTPNNASGTYTAEDIVVTYIYAVDGSLTGDDIEEESETDEQSGGDFGTVTENDPATPSESTATEAASTESRAVNPVTEEEKTTSAGDQKQETKIKKGTKITIGSGKKKVVYKVTDVSKKTVSVYSVDKAAVSITIGKSIKYQGKTYKITAIGDNALKNCKKLTKVTVGDNIKTIGKNAFYGCKNLKQIHIKSKVITKVGKNALKGINKKCKIKVPKSKLKKYNELFKGKG